MKQTHCWAPVGSGKIFSPSVDTFDSNGLTFIWRVYTEHRLTELDKKDKDLQEDRFYTLYFSCCQHVKEMEGRFIVLFNVYPGDGDNSWIYSASVYKLKE